MAKITVCNHSTTKSVSRVIDPGKYEKFLKLARVTAYVLRANRNFKTSLRSKATSQPMESFGKDLTSEEMESPEEYWYRTVQRDQTTDAKNGSLTCRESQSFTTIYTCGIRFHMTLVLKVERKFSTPKGVCMHIYLCIDTNGSFRINQ